MRSRKSIRCCTIFVFAACVWLSETLNPAVVCAQDSKTNSETATQSEVTAEQKAQARALREAATKGNVEAAKALIDAKVDVNAASEYGVTALSLACDHGHDEIVTMLLAAGANPNTKDSFYKAAPLTWATMRKHESIVKQLIAAGAEGIDGVLASGVLMGDEPTVKLALESKKVTSAGIVQAIQYGKMMSKDKLVALVESSLDEATKAEVTKLQDAAAAIATLAEFAGTYKSEQGTKQVIAVADGKLELTEQGSDKKIVMKAAGDDKADEFTADATSVSFQREDKKIKTLKMKTDASEVVYERIVAKVDNPVEPAVVLPEDKKVTLTEDYPLASEHWPSFRGTLARGVNTQTDIATEWSSADSKNIAWKTEIPGLATSSPIAWGKRVFVTTAICEADKDGFRVGSYGDVESVAQEAETQFVVLCVDLDSGTILWHKEATRSVPKVKRHAKSSHANPTPATDGEHLIASFGGNGIFCYDLDGNLKWERQLGLLDSGWFYDRTYQWGFGSSPFIFEDMVIVQCDVQDDPFIAALDLKTGKHRWQTARDEIPTWSSPIAYMAPDGTPTVVVIGTKCAAGYHARSGELLWKFGGFSEIVVPTPQVTPDLILLTSGYSPVQPIVAMSHAARGELKLPEAKDCAPPFFWSQLKGGPYMPSPLIHQQRLFLLDNRGVLAAVDLASGKRLFRKRVGAESSNAYTSSPVADAKHLYCTSESGITSVIPLDGDGTAVSQNELGESVLSSAAIAGGKLLIRGEKHLFAIEAKK